MIYQHNKKIGFLDLDANGDVRLTALLKYINDASWYHAESLGAGMQEMLKIGMVFVLQRFGLQMFSIPKMDDVLTIKTWLSGMTRSAFKRQGEILNSAGEIMIQWESLWVLIDIKERKIKRSTEFPVVFPMYDKLGVEIAAEKIKIPVESKKLTSYHHTVQYSELDLNGHMNNAIYADLVANVLSKIEKQSIKDIKQVLFNYVNEAKLNDELVVECNAIQDTLYVVGKYGESIVFTAKIK
jgi:acyl-ACP thioesterase